MNIIKVIVSLIILIGSAYASFNIPVTESGIPFTLQSLMVFVIAAILRPSMTVICIGLYLILGAVGLPVFAEGSSGLEKILGASGGFLYGFVFSGFFISYSFTLSQSIPYYRILVIFLVATIILFFFGLLHLSFKFDLSRALEYGLYPFWQMAIVKAIMASVIIYLVRQYSHKNLQNAIV